jgi:hypothetical protein
MQSWKVCTHVVTVIRPELSVNVVQVNNHRSTPSVPTVKYLAGIITDFNNCQTKWKFVENPNLPS